jgi:DNA-binding NarL/FixJ family response regulator
MLGASVAAVVSTGRQALDRIVLSPDAAAINFLILDLDMPDMTGLEVIKTLRTKAWKHPILTISGSHLATARDVLAAGANGFISKEEGQPVFAEAVRFLASSPTRTWLSPATHRQLLHTEQLLKKAGLTPAEQAVMRLAKLSNKEIADTLSISESTVKKHFWSIFQKLGISSRYDAITLAIEAGLIASR